jgi:hypothetical protein
MSLSLTWIWPLITHAHDRTIRQIAETPLATTRHEEVEVSHQTSRRSFLQAAGVLAAAASVPALARGSAEVTTQQGDPMKSDYRVRSISRGNGPAVHRYYDVPLEEPDGDRLIYFEFDDQQIPGPGNVIICGPNGESPLQVGRASHAIGHVGASQAWLGKGLICYTDRLPATITRIRDVDGDQQRDVAMEIRNFDVASRIAVGHRHRDQSTDGAAMEPTLVRWDMAADAFLPLVSVADILAVHPRADRARRELVTLKNAKFSPDGKQVLVVLSDEGWAETPSGRRWRNPTVKSLIVVPIDGTGFKYLGEFGHHPMWAPTGDGVIAHQTRRGGQDLAFFPLSGEGPRVLIADFVGTHSALDRAGQRVVTDVFGFPSEPDGSLLLYDVKTGRRETLVTGPHARRDHMTGSHPHPVWSRDERRIYFNHAASGVPQVYALEL